jgi:hypothetical protein
LPAVETADVVSGDLPPKTRIRRRFTKDWVAGSNFRRAPKPSGDEAQLQPDVVVISTNSNRMTVSLMILVLWSNSEISFCIFF